jgi:HK97 gp10 family phage protein
LSASVVLQGFDEAIEAMDRIGKALRRKALTDVAKEGLEPVLSDAKARAPVREGRFRDSLKIQVWEAEDDYAELEVYSDPDVALHGHMVEFGTRYTTGQPTLRPAFDARREEAERRVAIALKRKIEGAIR